MKILIIIILDVCLHKIRQLKMITDQEAKQINKAKTMQNNDTGN